MVRYQSSVSDGVRVCWADGKVDARKGGRAERRAGGRAGRMMGGWYDVYIYIEIIDNVEYSVVTLAKKDYSGEKRENIKVHGL